MNELFLQILKHEEDTGLPDLPTHAAPQVQRANPDMTFCNNFSWRLKKNIHERRAIKQGGETDDRPWAEERKERGV